MPETMKAILKTTAGHGAKLEEIKIPEIKDDEVLVKVKAASICGTDVHIYEWNKWAQSRIKNLPQILGHEMAGDVVKTGKSVRKIKEGDYVSAETHISCGHCIQCLNGQRHICSNLKILGVDTNGCFAEYVAVPESVCWKNSPLIPPHIASVQEPLGNAVHATLVEEVAGKTVAIVGDGPIGLFSTAVAKASDASVVFFVGLNSYRLELAKKLGADFLINHDNENAVKIVLEKTGGYGADVVMDMAGTQESIDDCFKMVRKGGRFTAFGIPSESITIDYANSIVFKGLTLYGINGRILFDTWIKTRNLLESGKLDISPVITHTIKLEEFKKGFDLMTARTKVCGKVVLIP